MIISFFLSCGKQQACDGDGPCWFLWTLTVFKKRLNAGPYYMHERHRPHSINHVISAVYANISIGNDYTDPALIMNTPNDMLNRFISDISPNDPLNEIGMECPIKTNRRSQLENMIHDNQYLVLELVFIPQLINRKN